VGLSPKSDWDAVQADAYVDTLNDLRQHFTPYFQEKDENKKKEIKDNIVDKEGPFYLSKFEKIIKDNNGTLIKDQVGILCPRLGAE